jgi:hypothetical protein
VNDVADIEQANSGDPVERRHQFRVAELGFSKFDRCLIGFDNRLFLSNLRLLRGELLLGCIPFLCKRLKAAEVDPPIFEMGRVAGKIGLCLIELRLKGARIELGQELSFFDILRTVAEFSAATLPIPVSTIGKFCFWTVAAITGTGGVGSATAAAELCAKCCQPR